VSVLGCQAGGLPPPPPVTAHHSTSCPGTSAGQTARLAAAAASWSPLASGPARETPAADAGQLRQPIRPEGPTTTFQVPQLLQVQQQQELPGSQAVSLLLQTASIRSRLNDGCVKDTGER
jgi:hypothetical protein